MKVEREVPINQPKANQKRFNKLRSLGQKKLILKEVANIFRDNPKIKTREICKTQIIWDLIGPTLWIKKISELRGYTYLERAEIHCYWNYKHLETEISKYLKKLKGKN